MNGLIYTFRSRPLNFLKLHSKAICYFFSKDRSSRTLEGSQYCVVYLSVPKYIFCEKYVTRYVLCMYCNVSDYDDNAVQIIHT